MVNDEDDSDYSNKVECNELMIIKRIVRLILLKIMAIMVSGLVMMKTKIKIAKMVWL